MSWCFYNHICLSVLVFSVMTLWLVSLIRNIDFYIWSVLKLQIFWKSHVQRSMGVNFILIYIYIKHFKATYKVLKLLSLTISMSHKSNKSIFMSEIKFHKGKMTVFEHTSVEYMGANQGVKLLRFQSCTWLVEVLCFSYCCYNQG